MEEANFMMTPKVKKEEERLMRMEYRANYSSEIYNIIIEKTTYNIIILINYYELKMNSQKFIFIN